MPQVSLEAASGPKEWAAAAVTALRCEVTDRGLSFATSLASRTISAAARMLPDSRRALLLTMAGARYSPHDRAFGRLASLGDGLFEACREIVLASAPPPRPMDLSRTLVLKEPRSHENGTEKGVILVKFTGTFAPLYTALQGTDFFRHFRVVLEPSWSGYALPDILCWFAANKGDVFVQTFDPRDRALLSALGLEPWAIPVGPGSWADYRTFHTVPTATKDYAVIYVANYTSMKRLHVFMRLCRRLRGAGHRSLLVCSSFGGHRVTAVRLARFYGVSDAIDMYEDISQQEVNGLLNKSRVSVLLSRKEGMNRGLSESLFAGVPMVVLEENVGNHSCINSRTGAITSEHELFAAVMRLMAASGSLDTRAWALESIHPALTTRAVETRLTEAARLAGEPWTMPLHVKINAPEARHLDDVNVRKFDEVLRALQSERVS